MSDSTILLIGAVVSGILALYELYRTRADPSILAAAVVVLSIAVGLAAYTA